MIDEKKLIEEIENLQQHADITHNLISFYALDNIKKYVENMPKVNEWIPVEERLPKEKEYVLIQNPYGVMSVACLLGGKWYNFQGVELWVAIAWMPLPKEYEKE